MFYILHCIYTTYKIIFIVEISTFVKTILYQIYIPISYSIAKFLVKSFHGLCVLELWTIPVVLLCLFYKGTAPVQRNLLMLYLHSVMERYFPVFFFNVRWIWIIVTVSLKKADYISSFKNSRTHRPWKLLTRNFGMLYKMRM